MEIGAKGTEVFADAGFGIGFNNEVTFGKFFFGGFFGGFDFADFADKGEFELFFDLFGGFDGAVEIIDGEDDASGEDDAGEGENDFLMNRVYIIGFFGFEAVVEDFGVFDVIEFANFFDEDFGGGVSDVLSGLRIFISDFDFDNFSALEGRNGDFRGEFSEIVVGGVDVFSGFGCEGLFDAIEDTVGLDNFSVGFDEVFIDVDFVLSDGFFLIATEDDGGAGLVEGFLNEKSVN